MACRTVHNSCKHPLHNSQHNSHRDNLIQACQGQHSTHASSKFMEEQYSTRTRDNTVQLLNSCKHAVIVLNSCLACLSAVFGFLRSWRGLQFVWRQSGRTQEDAVGRCQRGHLLPDVFRYKYPLTFPAEVLKQPIRFQWSVSGLRRAGSRVRSARVRVYMHAPPISDCWLPRLRGRDKQETEEGPGKLFLWSSHTVPY